MDGWDNFFVAMAGASVAFAGLVLVSISINLEKIIQDRGLIGRSAEPLIILVTLFISSSYILIPDQPVWVYGVEVLVTALVFSAVIGLTLFTQHQIFRTPNDPRKPPRFSFVIRLMFCIVSAGSLVLAGVLITLGHERGVFAMVPAMIAGFLLAFLDAWVLLIEIDR